MRRAEQLFDIETRECASPLADRVWRAQSVPSNTFISTAATHWEIVIWRHAAATYATLRGPETRATAMPIPVDAEFVGVQFRLGVFMPGLCLAALVDSGISIGAGDTLHLGGSEWEIPAYDNVEVFLGRLARAGLIRYDPLVADVVANQATGLSRRSMERRVRRATGLTVGVIRQIERAHDATRRLDAGSSISDAVADAGYADQAHLTRSLKRFMGQTPGRMVQEAR